MKKVKRIALFLLALALLQTLTFYIVGQDSLVKEIGKHYETFVLNEEGNIFKDVGLISEMEMSRPQIEENFPDFTPYNLVLCQSISDCSEIRNTSTFYIYYFENETNHPFAVNLIHESEMAYAFGANWESKYVWVLFTWILLEKANTGIA